MALCTTTNSTVTEKFISSHPHPSLHEIRNMCQLTLNKVLNMDITDRHQLVERLARSLSVEGIISKSNTAKTCSRTISLFVRQSGMKSQLEDDVQTDLCFTTTENQFNLEPIIEDDDKRHYSTKKAYQCPSQEYILSTPPTGYKPVCVQLLARHGSRSLNGHDYDLEILKIWQLANEKNMLTSLGKQLQDDIKLFMDANNHVGRGELTQVGREEHFHLATRLFNRLKPLFISSNKISVMSSGKKRAMDSADEFVNGLKTNECNLQILNENSNKKLLYFHKSCTNYMTFKKTDSNVKAKLNLIKYSEQSKPYAQQILKRIFTKDFVELLTNGNYQIEYDENNNPIENKKNEVDIVVCLYCMFVVAPAQKEPQLARMLAKYFNQEESNWFAYIADAQEFYLKGPSIEGTSITYDMAKPLLVDFFSSVNACSEGNNNVVANLRFSHAEIIIPFATLLQIPDFSDKSTNLLDVYTYENNQWRGDKVAPMGANIQWEIYRHEDHHNQILIRMLYNEMETRFKEDCKPITPDSFFYDFNELKRSYADFLLPSNFDVN